MVSSWVVGAVAALRCTLGMLFSRCDLAEDLCVRALFVFVCHVRGESIVDPSFRLAAFRA